MSALPSAVSWVHGGHGIVACFEGMKLLDEAVIRLYTRTSCDRMGEEVTKKGGKGITSLDDGNRLMDRYVASRHH
jgi:hypothetical protein